MLQANKNRVNGSLLLEDSPLATKFFAPVAIGPLISRPRLSTLLNESLKYPLTLICAPAGFGKTTLLSAWGHSLSANQSLMAWVSLDEEDNTPQSFWRCVFIALDQQQPERFRPLLTHLHSLQVLSSKSVLAALINLLVESPSPMVLILDDYHLITQEQIHTSLQYLVEHLPTHIHLLLATRTYPPFSLSLLRARHLMLEVRMEQLRCTTEEIRAFFQEVVDMHLSDEEVKEVVSRMEGWLVGLQLLGLSLQQHAHPVKLLEEISGDQCYILDYLTEEVLQQQPEEVQTFLLCTCILQQLSASLCDAVLEQTNSQQMLEWLELANLFVVALDSKRKWYRYHTLFAQALYHHLEQRQGDLMPILHHRASRWYAQHDQTTQAILHAFQAQEWQWAADLIEQQCHQAVAQNWGANEHELGLLRGWLEQLSLEVMSSRPHLCLTCSLLLWAMVPLNKLETWLEATERMLQEALAIQADEFPVALTQRALQEQQEIHLGEIIAFRAFLQSFNDDGPAVLALCQRALALLPEGHVARVHVAAARSIASYTSSVNDVTMAIENVLQGGYIAQKAEQPALAIASRGIIGFYEVGAGRLREAERQTHHTIQLGKMSDGLMLPDVSWPKIFQAEILREWNQLETARSVAEEAVSLCQQVTSTSLILYSFCAYAILLRVCLSCGDRDGARSAWHQFERIGKNTNRHVYLYARSLFTTVDQVRLWLACGEFDRATHWMEETAIKEDQVTPLELERREVAYARILLAKKQPVSALQWLQPALQRAKEGQRWGHVIEIRLLQALAYLMDHEVSLALAALSEAVYLAEPEGYVRSFVDEGTPMAMLLSRLRKDSPTPYLDRLLAAFPYESKTPHHQSKLIRTSSQTQWPDEPLSKREREVLQALAHGASNQEIAQDLVIALDTVKRHVTHIFSKLGVQNRVQAVRQAQLLNLLDEDFEAP